MTSARAAEAVDGVADRHAALHDDHDANLAGRASGGPELGLGQGGVYALSNRFPFGSSGCRSAAASE